MMASVRDRNTKPELRVRRFLHAAGFRYRLHDRTLDGAPDIVLPKYKTVIFVHGCFWHQHSQCPKSTLPTTNRRFWQVKLRGNATRDVLVRRSLRRKGWQVLVVWECRTKDSRHLARVVAAIRQGPHSTMLNVDSKARRRRR
jgi:DNA mismatch endonuclease (patch repair protein)